MVIPVVPSATLENAPTSGNVRRRLPFAVNVGARKRTSFVKTLKVGKNCLVTTLVNKRRNAKERYVLLSQILVCCYTENLTSFLHARNE